MGTPGTGNLVQFTEKENLLIQQLIVETLATAPSASAIGQTEYDILKKALAKLASAIASDSSVLPVGGET